MRGGHAGALVEQRLDVRIQRTESTQPARRPGTRPHPAEIDDPNTRQSLHARNTLLPPDVQLSSISSRRISTVNHWCAAAPNQTALNNNVPALGARLPHRGEPVIQPRHGQVPRARRAVPSRATERRTWGGAVGPRGRSLHRRSCSVHLIGMPSTKEELVARPDDSPEVADSGQTGKPEPTPSLWRRSDLASMKATPG